MRELHTRCVRLKSSAPGLFDKYVYSTCLTFPPKDNCWFRLVHARPAGRANILKSQLKCKHVNEAAHQNGFHNQFSLVQKNGGGEVLAPYVI